MRAEAAGGRSAAWVLPPDRMLLGLDIRECTLTIMVRLSRPQVRPSAAFLEYKSSDQRVTNVAPVLR